MKRCAAVLLAVIVSFATSFSAFTISVSALEDDGPRVTSVRGDAVVYKFGGYKSIPIYRNMTFASGDVIKTGDGGSVSLTYYGKDITVGELTLLSIDSVWNKYNRDDSSITLIEGMIKNKVHVELSKNSRNIVRASNTIAGVRGTEYILIYSRMGLPDYGEENPFVRIRVIEGTVRFDFDVDSGDGSTVTRTYLISAEGITIIEEDIDGNRVVVDEIEFLPEDFIQMLEELDSAILEELLDNPAFAGNDDLKNAINEILEFRAANPTKAPDKPQFLVYGSDADTILPTLEEPETRGEPIYPSADTGGGTNESTAGTPGGGSQSESGGGAQGESSGAGTPGGGSQGESSGGGTPGGGVNNSTDNNGDTDSGNDNTNNNDTGPGSGRDLNHNSNHDSDNDTDSNQGNETGSGNNNNETDGDNENNNGNGFEWNHDNDNDNNNDNGGGSTGYGGDNGDGGSNNTNIKTDMTVLYKGLSFDREPVYDTAPHNPVPLFASDSGAPLPAHDDYTVSYANNINAGMATVTITATETSAFTGTITDGFDISKANPTPQYLPYSLQEISYGMTLGELNVDMVNNDARVPGGGAVFTPGSWVWADGNAVTPPLGDSYYAIVFTPLDYMNYNTYTIYITISVGGGGQQIENGTGQYPYLIWNVDDLISMNKHINHYPKQDVDKICVLLSCPVDCKYRNGAVYPSEACYVLMTNIDMNNAPAPDGGRYDWLALGRPGTGYGHTFFGGIFEGNGNKISNLYSTSGGFFGVMRGDVGPSDGWPTPPPNSCHGVVRNLGLENVDISSTSGNAGAVAVLATEITNCWVTGKISVALPSSVHTGGIAGSTGCYPIHGNFALLDEINALSGTARRVISFIDDVKPLYHEKAVYDITNPLTANYASPIMTINGSSSITENENNGANITEANVDTLQAKLDAIYGYNAPNLRDFLPYTGHIINVGTLGSADTAGAGWSYNAGGKILSITGNGEYVLTGANSDLIVALGQNSPPTPHNMQVTLAGVTISSSYAVQIQQNNNITLNVTGGNILPGIYVQGSGSSTLLVTGDGTLSSPVSAGGSYITVNGNVIWDLMGSSPNSVNFVKGLAIFTDETYANAARVYGSFELGSDFQIASNRTMYFNSGSSLVIKNGISFHNYGTITNRYNSSATNYFYVTITNYGMLTNDGTIQLKGMGKLENYGSFMNKNTVENDNSIDNYGTLICTGIFDSLIYDYVGGLTKCGNSVSGGGSLHCYGCHGGSGGGAGGMGGSSAPIGGLSGMLPSSAPFGEPGLGAGFDIIPPPEPGDEEPGEDDNEDNDKQDAPDDEDGSSNDGDADEDTSP